MITALKSSSCNLWLDLSWIPPPELPRVICLISLLPYLETNHYSACHHPKYPESESLML